ncbi:MAG: carboxypeptidase-like regulatory domain-containing protein [Planctomycetaceae bacterium]|nr:carboxypeptidase-like regulatory domain-containing protein [Planctomycetaceae bacterium]
MRTFIFFTLSIALLFQAGCGDDPNRPADLPRLYPVKITINQSGSPLEEATVTLHSKTPTKYGTSSASTDSSGVAALRTYGFDGVPLGEYTVTIEKRGIEGGNEVTDEFGGTTLVGGRIFQYVDSQYVRSADSPLSIEVTERGATDTFDVGAPVHIFLGNLGG